MSLKVSAILPRRPSSSPVIRTEKSPARIARSACKRFCNSSGEPGAELSSSDLPARFFSTPLAIFLLVTVVGCIDASRITRLHHHACAWRGRSEAIRCEQHVQRPIISKPRCHGCSPHIWGQNPGPPDRSRHWPPWSARQQLNPLMPGKFRSGGAILGQRPGPPPIREQRCRAITDMVKLSLVLSEKQKPAFSI